MSEDTGYLNRSVQCRCGAVGIVRWVDAAADGTAERIVVEHDGQQHEHRGEELQDLLTRLAVGS